MPSEIFRKVVIGIVGVVALLTLSSALFTVSETQQAIVVQFGQPRLIYRTPGLKVKVPFVQDVVYFEKRILDLDMPAQEVLSIDQLRLTVDAFARYRITDPLRSYLAAGDVDRVGAQISGVLASKLRDELGEKTFATLLSPERGALMDVIQASVNTVAKQYGAEIIDVRIKRADLPAGEPLSSAYERMKTARQQEAMTIRADGSRQAQLIQAGADSEAARIYAQSFGKDPDFYAFYRSMQAYRESLKKEDTTIVLSPDSEFFRQFGGR